MAFNKDMLMPALDRPLVPQPEVKKYSITLPNSDDIKELCLAATPATTRRLIDIALDDSLDAKVVLTAIREIHDRAFGKPTQTIEGSISIEQIDRTILELEKRMAAEGIELDPIDQIEDLDEVTD